MTTDNCSLITDIRFAYPNIDSQNRFIGCGRYFTARYDAPEIGDAQEADDPKMGSLSKVLTVASMLAPESFETDLRIYECKDEPLPYLGDSKGLAYLLALIRRGGRSRWKSETQDIWCTGTVHIVNDRPFLKEVFPNLFGIKMASFISQTKDRLFIVPLANLKTKHIQMAEAADVRVMSLAEFRRMSARKVFEQKTVLKIHGNELEALVRYIFGKSAFPIASFIRPETRKYAGIGILICICLFMIFRIEKISVRAAVLCWNAKLFFSSHAGDPSVTDPLTGMAFMGIPGGCFEMGCGKEGECFENETPLHTVCLNSFYMSRNEVTQGQWEKIMQSNPSTFSDCGPDCPVESVSWKNVQEFIRRRNQHPDVSGSYRLPTEAEWEYACRMGEEEEFLPDTEEIRKVGNFCPDASGICDMKGNVLEWCEDRFQDNAYEKHGIFSPLVSGESEYKVVRGGSWSSPPEYEPCTRRFRYGQEEKFSDVGFRLVWEK